MASATPGLRLPSQPQGIAALWPVPNYRLLLGDRKMRANNLPTVVTWQRKAGDRTRDLLSRRILPYTSRPQPCTRRDLSGEGGKYSVTVTHVGRIGGGENCPHYEPKTRAGHILFGPRVVQKLQQLCEYLHIPITPWRFYVPVLFRSLAVLDPRVGHTVDVLSPFVFVLCHSDRLFHWESCPRLDAVHPGRAWSSSPACTWHFMPLRIL